MGDDIIVGIGVVVPAELPGPEGALQVTERIAVRLERAEQKSQLKPSGVKAFLTPQKGGGQKGMAAFLHGSYLQSTRTATV